MDALSDVLRSVQLEGAVFVNAEFTAPWCIWSRFGLARASKRLAAADHMLFFHFLTEGSCQLRLPDGGPALEVTAGDLVLFPRDVRHLMGSDLQLAPVEEEGVMPAGFAPEDADFVHLRHGGGGEATRFVCGYLAGSRGVCRPLLDALPPVLRIPVGDGPSTAWLRELLRVGVRESATARPGADSMLAKLSEFIFVEALRRYIETMPPGSSGWLAGLRDAQVGQALALLHAHPDRPWTVEDLAREVALSRSALAERFVSLVGDPPIQYLLRWRLALAAQALRSGRDAISRVAERCGYESEAAFSRAFKREFGMPPAQWRKAGKLPLQPQGASPRQPSSA